MLNFKKIELKDINTFKKYISSTKEYSCETSFVNLLIWQEAYGNMAAFEDGQLIFKSGFGDNCVFRLPFGNDFNKGIRLIQEYSGKKYPEFWVQDGIRLDELKEFFNDKYVLIENRDAFDYIYLREDLANLTGKKYHSKRNHISSFSKSNVWHYEPITEDNISDIKICAEKWYAENRIRSDKYLECERKGLDIILDNMDLLGIIGGAVFVDGMAVAFTLGSSINSDVFDIHIEKALGKYSTAYTLINNEFAKRELENYKFINREDDMGLEGLRKAKLSYKPYMLIKKYYCRPKADIEI